MKDFIRIALEEDLGDTMSDHTSLATITTAETGKAKLLIKDMGVLAGIDIACEIFNTVDPTLQVTINLHDGNHVDIGEEAFVVEGSVHSILKSERLVLNVMQRMSAIATKTHHVVEIIKPFGCKVLDTRKTTPGMRLIEKEAVRIGGGVNHRAGLYDMILIKDNHVDYAGGVGAAIMNTRNYLEKEGLTLPVVIETRSMKEVEVVLEIGGVDRILLDNFSPERIAKAVALIDGKFPTEASGGITEDNCEEYARAGANYISMGALTHSVKAFDLSLKAL